MSKNVFTLLIFALYIFSVPFAYAKTYEKHYNEHWCTAQDGILEYATEDKSRVDCLTKEYAVECDHAYKWKEAVGQSLFYAIQTGKRPGILLIVKDPVKERKYVERLNIVAEKYDIKVWYITPDDL